MYNWFVEGALIRALIFHDNVPIVLGATIEKQTLKDMNHITI